MQITIALWRLRRALSKEGSQQGEIPYYSKLNSFYPYDSNPIGQLILKKLPVNDNMHHRVPYKHVWFGNRLLMISEKENYNRHTT